MKKSNLATAGVFAVAASVMLSGCAFGGGGSNGDGQSDGPVEITFQSLAYQDSTIAATEEIVAQWNQENPDITVKLTQGSWDNVHDQLVTQFQGGTAPDVIHDESSDILGFAAQGYLADLSPYLSDDVKNAVSDDVWETVTTDDKIVAAPTLLQTYVVYANFVISSHCFPHIGWGLKQPTAAIMNTALGFDGTFFEGGGADATISVGDPELAVAEHIHSMAYTDGSLDPVSLTQSGSDVLPGFLGGKYAMYIGGNFLAQQITEAAPEDFNWTVLPPLAGSAGPIQAANPQTMSVAAESEHIEQSAKFIDFFMGAENQAKLAQGDWLIPASSDARAVVAAVTFSPQARRNTDGPVRR